MDKITQNPFSDAVRELNSRYARPESLPQFGLATVTAVTPELHVTFAGLDFAQSQILRNYTATTHTVDFEATALQGALYGYTDVCAQGGRNFEKNVSSAGAFRSSLSGKMTVDPLVQPGDRMLAYYSQTDQLLVLLAKVVQ